MNLIKETLLIIVKTLKMINNDNEFEKSKCKDLEIITKITTFLRIHLICKCTTRRKIQRI